MSLPRLPIFLKLGGIAKLS